MPRVHEGRAICGMSLKLACVLLFLSRHWERTATPQLRERFIGEMGMTYWRKWLTPNQMTHSAGAPAGEHCHWERVVKSGGEAISTAWAVTDILVFVEGLQLCALLYETQDFTESRSATCDQRIRMTAFHQTEPSARLQGSQTSGSWEEKRDWSSVLKKRGRSEPPAFFVFSK